MKKIIVGCLLLLFAVPFALQAEERTLVGGKPEYGWYVAPVIKLTRINDEFSVITGVRSGAIFSHFLAAGIGVYGNIKLENNDSLVFIDYGGFDFEFIFLSNSLIHGTANILFGPGIIIKIVDLDDVDEEDVSGDIFFTMEPGLNLEVNITPWFRIAAGVSYRYNIGFQMAGYGEDAFSGFSGNIMFKFGNF